MKASVRCAGVVVAICSWIAISNHCAFATLAPAADSAETACPFHSTPAKQKEQSSQVQCCKLLRATVLAQTKAWARDDAEFSDADLYAEEGAFSACAFRSVTPLLLDTGPPDAHSFAELILQGSLFAHAPPSRA